MLMILVQRPHLENRCSDQSFWTHTHSCNSWTGQTECTGVQRIGGEGHQRRQAGGILGRQTQQGFSTDQHPKPLQWVGEGTWEGKNLVHNIN